MIKLARKSLRLIRSCDIDGYLKTANKRHYMYHGDYNSNNALFTKDGHGLIIDFEAASFGPPIYDFRFLMSSVNRPENDALYTEHRKKRMKIIVSDYFRYCTHAQPFKKLYIYDSLFPHEFHLVIKKGRRRKQIKKLDRHRKQLIQLADREREKYEFLKKKWV